MNVHSVMKNDEIKNIIIEKALTLFAEKGFHGTSIKILAQTSGISQGLMYNYFESKEHLLIAIFEKSFEQIKDSFQFNKTGKPEKDLKKYFEILIESVRKNRDFWRFVHSIRTTNLAALIPNDRMKWLLGMIYLELEKLINISSETNNSKILYYFATIDGIIGHFLVIDNYPIESVFNELYHSIMKMEEL